MVRLKCFEHHFQCLAAEGSCVAVVQKRLVAHEELYVEAVAYGPESLLEAGVVQYCLAVFPGGYPGSVGLAAGEPAGLGAEGALLSRGHRHGALAAARGRDMEDDRAGKQGCPHLRILVRIGLDIELCAGYFHLGGPCVHEEFASGVFCHLEIPLTFEGDLPCSAEARRIAESGVGIEPHSATVRKCGLGGHAGGGAEFHLGRPATAGQLDRHPDRNNQQWNAADGGKHSGKAQGFAAVVA